jgi:hypothetical protein
MKIGVIEFSTLPLVAPSQKPHVLPRFANDRMENAFFMCQVKKTLVMKVVGLVKMHISTKNGVKIQKFDMELA